MKYRVEVHLTKERISLKPTVLWEGHDWREAKEKFNFWANEYRDDMDRISIRRVAP